MNASTKKVILKLKIVHVNNVLRKINALIFACHFASESRIEKTCEDFWYVFSLFVFLWEGVCDFFTYLCKI